jgi:hypothetical protein
MSARLIHVIVVLVIAALFANGQCYALCLASLNPTVSQQQAGDCHESQPSHHDGSAGCHHRQAHFTSTEASPDLARIAAVSLPLIVFLPSTSVFAAGPALFPQLKAAAEQRGSPPGIPLFLSLSVLRI